MALSLVSVVETLRIMRARLSANSMRTLRRPPSRDRQSGAVAVLVGIALVEQRGGREGVAAVGSTLGRIALAAVEMCITG